MMRPFVFPVSGQDGEVFQLVVAHNALCGAFVRKPGWSKALGAGISVAGGEVGLVPMILLLPVLIVASWKTKRHENAITTWLKNPNFEPRDERDFRLPREQIGEVIFSHPLRGDRFTGNWRLEALLKSGDVRVWTLEHRGTPRVHMKALRALEVPVHPG